MSTHTKMLTDMLANHADVEVIVQMACTVITNLELNLAQERKKKDQPHALEATWELPDEGRSYALGLGWSEERVAAEARKFRDRALAKGAKYKDWHAAWRNWCHSPYQGGDLSLAERKFVRQEKTVNALNQLHLFAAKSQQGNGSGNN